MCGIERTVIASNIRNGISRSCGCLRSAPIDYKLMKPGSVIAHWTLLEFVPGTYTSDTERSNPHWKCRCSCGNEQLVAAYNLANRSSKSCGHERMPLSKEELAKYENLPYGLTVTQAICLEGIMTHKTALEFSKASGRSRKTVEIHMHRIYDKMRAAGVMPESCAPRVIAFKLWLEHRAKHPA